METSGRIASLLEDRSVVAVYLRLDGKVHVRRDDRSREELDRLKLLELLRVRNFQSMFSNHERPIRFKAGPNWWRVIVGPETVALNRQFV